MPRKGIPIDPQIKCPKCGAFYPNIKHNGSYMRDGHKIPQFLCEKCKKCFSASVIAIKILKPPIEVEIGCKIKIEAKVRSLIGQGINEVKFVADDNNGTAAISFNLSQTKAEIYIGVWDLTIATPKKIKINIVAIDKQNYISIQPRTILVKEHYDNLIWKIAPKYSLDPFLLKGMIWKESTFNPKIISSKGAIGLTQLLPATAKEMGVVNPYVPQQNIEGGAKYLKLLIDRYQGDIRVALGAYNWGPGNVARVAMNEKKFPKSVIKHINRVLELKTICESNYQNSYENK
jgi:hypothetical protein